MQCGIVVQQYASDFWLTGGRFVFHLGSAL